MTFLVTDSEEHRHTTPEHNILAPQQDLSPAVVQSAHAVTEQIIDMLYSRIL